MNKYDFCFWAQNLNNEEEDYAEINGKSLSDQNEREELAQNISQITTEAEGEKIETDNVSSTIYYHNSQFIIKLIWSITDTLGRKAPIICYGVFPSFYKESEERIYFDTLLDSFEKFSAKIGRDFGDESDSLQELFELSFNKIKEKNHYSQNLPFKIINKKKSLIMGIGAGGTIAALTAKVPLSLSLVPLLGATCYCLLNDQSSTA